MLVSATQRRDVGFKLTYATDNSRIPGQAPAIPVKVYVGHPICREMRWNLLCQSYPYSGCETDNFVMRFNTPATRDSVNQT